MTRTVVITGGSSGIGLGIAKAALARGWSVAVIDLPGESLAELADRADPMLRTWGVDITDEAAVTDAVAEIAGALGPLHGVVNSAGIGRNVPVAETSVEDFRRVLEVNVLGTFIVARAAAAHMAEDGGSIVNISSVNGIRGTVGRIAYGSSKGAVNTMTRILAVEFAPRGIRVNAIAPGPIETPMALRWHDAATRDQWTRRIPLRRYGAVSEVAGTALFLLDAAQSGYVTGQVIAVDGGFTVAGLLEASP